MRRFRSVAVLAAATVLFVACAPQETRPPPAPTAATAVESTLQRRYDDLARSGKPVFDIDPARSLVVVEVRRAGTLASVGHDHVVASHDLRGYVAPSEGRADVLMRADTLAVDEDGSRAEVGFDTHPTADDIAGTRRNMLRILRADEHPFVVASVEGIRAVSGAQVVRPTFTVAGVDRATEAPATIEMTGDSIRITGRTSIRQTDFGIRPFSILGGALQVDDAVPVRFDIVARKR